MNSLLIGLLSALASTNPPAAVNDFVTATIGIPLAAATSTNLVDIELAKLIADDNATMEQVEEILQRHRALAKESGALTNAEIRAMLNSDLSERLKQRVDPVRQRYEDLIQRHPTNASVRVAYASFLNELHDEEGSAQQLQKALEFDPKDPAIWNNLANYYGHRGPPTKAFEYYEKAVELDPSEPVYFWNFATTVYLFRKDAREYYHVEEQQVFDKALDLYAKALKLDPTNFAIATDLAETYYGIRPVRTDAALAAWTNALSIARNDYQREAVCIHLARLKLNAGRFAEVRAHLNAVTNGGLADLKDRIARNLGEKEKLANATNTPPAPAKDLGGGAGK